MDKNTRKRKSHIKPNLFLFSLQRKPQKNKKKNLEEKQFWKSLRPWVLNTKGRHQDTDSRITINIKMVKKNHLETSQ